jgi:hypothetical protein
MDQYRPSPSAQEAKSFHYAYSEWLSDLGVLLHGIASHAPEFDAHIELGRVKHRYFRSRRVAIDAPNVPRAIEKPGACNPSRALLTTSAAMNRQAHFYAQG